MLARLSSLYFDIPSLDGSRTDRIYPLKQLATRDTGDPSIALLDAWAVVADVLTFYQERIANEGYLRTATERRSILELARLVGYKLRPGIASSVYLAFTVSNDLESDIPAGTRAQSVPGTGETAQFFETSEKLPARYAWNNLKPRLTRPQVITPPATNSVDRAPIVTGADVIDTLYFQGVSTNLKTGDALLLVFGGDPGTAKRTPQQILRFAESVDPQAGQNRTEVTLVQPPLRIKAGDPISTVGNNVQPFIDAATVLFPGSDIASSVAKVLQNLIDNVKAIRAGMPDPRTIAANFILGAIPAVQQSQDIVVKRGFTRLAAWIGHLSQMLRDLAVGLPSAEAVTSGPGAPSFKRSTSTLDVSPLGKLGATLDRLALPPSLQPANAQRLRRTIAQTFSPQSDIAPQLLAAFRPSAASTLYEVWANVETPASRVEVQAMRVKAKFFASTYPGLPVVDVPIERRNADSPAVPSNVSRTRFISPTLGPNAGLPSAWDRLVADQKPVKTIPLDATYDQIKPKSWVAIDRPRFTNAGDPDGRVTTYHSVIDVRTSSMDTQTGFTAKVTLLTLQPPWLTGADGLTGADDIATVLSGDAKSTTVLRDTVVYAQSEPLDIADEPLDTDVEKATIELAELYDGIEPGRWIIVSGSRTDIPNVSGVPASELVMVAAVNQGSQPPLSQCAAFPSGFIPFKAIDYTTDANAQGDRLVIGTLNDEALETIRKLPNPTVANQKYCEPVQLAKGVFVNAYVPTEAERKGRFPDFLGLFVDPKTGLPSSQGEIVSLTERGIFAWRIFSEPVHTILTLANGLAYKYDARTVTLYGNVVNATHGQTVAEVLGNGDASQPFQTFALHQPPLTYLPALTPAGAQSTLTVRVNEIAWQEANELASLGPTSRSYITQTDDADKTSVIFGNGEHGARPSSGNVNIKATYRYGIGKPGNVKAQQISQLATRPLGLDGVVNPLPATGGADRDSPNQARRNIPIAVKALDRLVSVEDYADFARAFAGIGKASAARLSDGRRQVLHVTIAGADDIPIDVNSDLYRNLVQALHQLGDPFRPIQVCVRKIQLLVIFAGIKVLADYEWESVESQVRAALLDAFSFDRCELGQSAFLSEAVSLMQGVEGVAYVDVQAFDSVHEDITTEELSSLATRLTAPDQPHPYIQAQLARPGDPAAVEPCRRILPAELAFLTPDIPGTLVLTEISG